MRRETRQEKTCDSSNLSFGTFANAYSCFFAVVSRWLRVGVMSTRLLVCSGEYQRLRAAQGKKKNKVFNGALIVPSQR
jgi:hypothetical protein